MSSTIVAVAQPGLRPVALTHAFAMVRTEYTYEPFGITTIVTGGFNTNPYQFAGRENDATGLYYYYDAPDLVVLLRKIRH
jgi:hypothetical protein